MDIAQKYWDKSAAKYAQSAIGDEATYQRKLAETQALFTPDMHILEFGCGTGTTAVHHAPHVRQIDAIDISAKMLEIGRQRAHAAEVNNIRFSRGTLTEFAAAPASIDMVLGLNVIHLLADRQATLNEVARILKPGGAFVSSTVCLGSSWLRYLKVVVPLGKMLGLLPDVYVIKETQLEQEMAEAGFTIERQWQHAKGGVAVFIIARKT